MLSSDVLGQSEEKKGTMFHPETMANDKLL